MKLRELHEESMKEYHDRLVSTLNIQKLGSGAYAHVFQHPAYSNVVVKVYTDSDTTYKKYMAWCMKHQSNPYVPQIIEDHPIESNRGEKYHIVFMEKMTPMSESKFRGWLYEMFGEHATDAYREQDYHDLFLAMNMVIEKSKDTKLREVWNHIKSYGVERFDVHHNNVMLRGSQLVFTDPVGDSPAGDRADDH